MKKINEYVSCVESTEPEKENTEPRTGGDRLCYAGGGGGGLIIHIRDIGDVPIFWSRIMSRIQFLGRKQSKI